MGNEETHSSFLVTHYSSLNVSKLSVKQARCNALFAPIRRKTRIKLLEIIAL